MNSNPIDRKAEKMSEVDIEVVSLDVKKIMLATDGSSPSVEAIKYAVALAKLLQAELVALYVDEQFALLQEEKYEEELYEGVKHSAAGLQVAQWYGEKNGIEVKTILKQGSAPKKIIATAKEEEADLIVIGTTGRTGLKRIAIGSVAEMVMKAAHVPVMVIRNFKVRS
ncbi:MAG: universal stress protein [Methanobacteriaceae archaeon]|nr:universal stress protein [Methanobacteriaceae archaeon]